MTMTAPPRRPQFRPQIVAPRLTPRQKQVLDLLTKRHTNPQIARALGISLDGAKWHVSEIIGVLGVDSREEAADWWREYNGLPSRIRRRVAAIFTLGSLARWGSGTGAVAALAGFAALVYVAFAGLGTSEEPAASDAPGAQATVPSGATPSGGSGPSATVPAATATASVPGASGSGRFTVAAPVRSVPSTVAYKVTGCWQCDGPDASLQRYVTDESGNVSQRTMLDRNDPALGGWTPAQFAAAADGSLLAVLACENREYCGAMGPYQPDLRWKLLTSPDGGVTWSPAGEYRGYAHLTAVTGGVVYVTESAAVEGGVPPGERFYAAGRNGNRPIPVPAGADAQIAYGRTLIPLRNGSVTWLSNDRFSLLDASGQTLVARPRDADTQIGYVVEGPNGELTIGWDRTGGNPLPAGSPFFEGTFAQDGTLLSSRTVTEAFVPTGYLSDRYAFGNLDSFKLGGQTAGGNYPVLYDLADGTVRPILGLFEANQRNRVEAVIAGNVFEVTGAGDCLNVRETAAAGQVLGCYADGVLLYDLGREEQSNGGRWLAVRTPDGRPGWASAQFLR